MADRTKLDSNFISLVLSVNGRVRPIDLHGLPEPERARALQAFQQANAASLPCYFDGDVLVKGVAGAPAAPPASATAPPAEQPVSDYASAPVPAPVSAAVSAPAPVSAPVSDYASASASAPAPVSDYAPSVPTEPSVPAAPTPPNSDFFPMPPAGSAEAPSDNPPAAEFDLPAEKISFLFWLLPVFLTWVGGIIAFFLVRKLNPKTAKAMLITGIVLTVVFAVAGVAAAVGLGLLTIPGL